MDGEQQVTQQPGRTRHPRGDAGQATIDNVGIVAIAVILVGAIAAAFASNHAFTGDRISVLICQILTAGTGDCGGAVGEARQPDAPCLLAGSGDEINLGIAVTFVEIGGGRALMIEELSDGTYRVTQTTSSNVGLTAGVGASTSFTVADNNVGAGASASVSGGVTFAGGPQWIVDSEEELEQLKSAENWDRIDAVVGGLGGPVGGFLTFSRDLFGIGEEFPPPDRIFVEGGVEASASAYAGAGTATAQAGLEGSSVLGFSYEPEGNGEKTFYIKSTYSGEAGATLAGGTDNVGGEVSGEATVLTEVTVDADGNIVKAKRSSLATGESAGFTNMLFGGDPSVLTSDQVGTGTQWDATLEVESDADRDAVLALLASTGINPSGLGVDAEPGGLEDPLGERFMERVRNQGDLTRHSVEVDDKTLFEGSGEVAAAAKLSLNGGYAQNSMTAGDHEYWDGRGFAPRTNC